jgi:hypothetical protein
MPTAIAPADVEARLAVAPTLEGEQRCIVSMQYQASGEMSPLMRFVSNLKDSIACFGPRRVFFGGKRRQPAARP